MANFWMHNGFLQVEGEKMSKSLGNFITINELLATDKFGGQPWHGRVVRLAMLGTHYRQPIDWTVDRLAQARATLSELAETLAGVAPSGEPHPDIIGVLEDDLNTPSAISIIHGLAKSAKRGNAQTAAELKSALQFLGLYDNEKPQDFFVGSSAPQVDEAEIARLIQARLDARRDRNFKEADRIRDELAANGIALKDGKDPKTGEIVTTWEVRR
jgi:cysteinyl-tRNA synthetase